MEKTNFIPRDNYMLVSANIKKMKDTNIILGKDFNPEIKSIQKVIEIGPRVENFKPGDWVFIDIQRFVKHVKTRSSIKAGVGGQEMIKEQLVLPFFEIPGDDNVYLKITDREAEGKIRSFDMLPKEEKEFSSMKDFVKNEDDKLKN